MLKSEKLKLVVQQAAEKVTRYRYHYISNKIALTSLAEIEKEKGKLSSQTKKIAHTYAVEVLGWKGYAPWLYVYAHLAGEFKEGWIPDNYYGKVVIPKIQGAYGKISFLNSLTNQLFNKEVSPDIAYYNNGLWFEKNFRPTATKNIRDILFAETDRVVFKLDNSYQGRGVFQIVKEEFNRGFIEQKGNGVIQKYIQQHPFFNEFLTSAVATIRITTVVEIDNSISIRACYLRLGRFRDTHVKSKNHIRIPIDRNNGRLNDEGYLANWKTVDQHPDSKVAFLNKVIPNYKECVALVLRLHKKMPMVQCIGWDVVVDQNSKPMVMEWNGYSNDIKFSEATQGPCFTGLGWEEIHKHPRKG